MISHADALACDDMTRPPKKPVLRLLSDAVQDAPGMEGARSHDQRDSNPQLEDPETRKTETLRSYKTKTLKSTKETDNRDRERMHNVLYNPATPGSPAKLVCLSPFELKGEFLTRRWVPFSALRYPYANLQGTAFTTPKAKVEGVPD